MKFLTIIMIVVAISAADLSTRIGNAISEVSQRSGVSPEIYYTIIEIESGFQPWVITTVAGKEAISALKTLAGDTVGLKIRDYKDKYIVNFIGRDKKILSLAKKLYDAGINFDCGVMQINSSNIDKSELDLIFDVRYNIAKGSNILADCAEAYNGLHDVIECYNKGYREKIEYDYFNKFILAYMKNWGVSR